MWRPLSVLSFGSGGNYASPGILTAMLRSSSPVPLTYFGDRMWPAVRHGQAFGARPIGPEADLLGRAVIVAPEGIPDLLRAAGSSGRRVVLRADADPAVRFEVDRAELIAAADLPVRRVRPMGRRLRIGRHLVREALSGRPDEDGDPALSVLAKYDEQSAFYDREARGALPDELREILRSRSGAGSTVLVAGCGTGRECRVLAGWGHRVLGVDFSPRMIEIARRACASMDDAIELRLTDLRSMDPPGRAVGAALFTPDVYSFVPDGAERIALLKKMADWLGPGGPVLLSARRAAGLGELFFLTLHWLASRGARRRGWGSSHARWIDLDGRIRRNYVKYFTAPQLARELGRAGWQIVREPAGWLLLEAVSRARRPRGAPRIGRSS